MILPRTRHWSPASGPVTPSLLLLLLVSVPCLLHAQPQTDPLALLTRVAQVRHLDQQRAAQAVPVRLRGVVTAFSGYSNSFFVQDAQEGISVDRTDSAQVHAGDEVEITGTSDAGGFAPVILANEVRVLGRATLPTARPVRYSDLLGGAQDSQRIEVEGVIQAARPDILFGHTVLLLHLNFGGNSVNAFLQDLSGVDANHLIDATVRVRGVCSSSFNKKRQFTGVGLFVPTARDIVILQPAGPEPYAVPATPIHNVLQFSQALHRVKVVGTVTHQVPGHILYLQDGNDGISVQTTSTQPIAIGRRVEALGFPVLGDYAPMLINGSFREIGPGTPIVPQRVEAQNMIVTDGEFNHAPFDEQLVQTRATLMENRLQGTKRVLVMQQAGQVFEVWLPLSAAGKRLEGLRPGTILDLVGICNVQSDADRYPVTFSIAARSASDITVVQRAPWWNKIHTLTVLGITAGITLVAVLWIVILRRRVEQQTRIIRASEERFRNLAQTDALTGLPNLYMLEDRIAEILARSASNNNRAVLFTIDIDRFKQINDTYGHPVGDQCLKIVAQRLQGRVRKVDTIARTGGEEFTQVVGSIADLQSARRVADGILELFYEPLRIADREIRINISIGASLYPDDSTNIEQLRQFSDHALYAAKRAGGDRTVFCCDEAGPSTEDSMPSNRPSSF